MSNYYPILFVGALVGLITVVLSVVYFTVKDKKQDFGFDRNMKDSEIVKRLLVYAAPHKYSFVLALFIMAVSVAYDISSPLIVGYIQEMIKSDFAPSRLFSFVGLYASILLVSLVCTYFQAIILQRAGQRIVSKLREDVFAHIQSLSHGQLNHTPVGVFVTRVSNDCEHILRLFSNLIVEFAKNVVLVVGVLVAMLFVNFTLTLVALSFVPFVILFTVIFNKLLRRAYRRVKNATTDINVFLSENLSGMKITQIFNREAKKAEEFNERNMLLYKYRRGRILR